MLTVAAVFLAACKRRSLQSVGRELISMPRWPVPSSRPFASGRLAPNGYGWLAGILALLAFAVGIGCARS